MTIRRQWLMVLFLVAILSVAINTLVLGSLTDRSFKNYMQSSYNEQVSKIIEYSKSTLEGHGKSTHNSTLEINSFLVDPIKSIMIYDIYGNLVVNVSSKTSSYGNGYGGKNGNGSNKMMNHMMGSQLEESDTFDISHDGKIYGSVSITRNSSIENSITSRLFMSNLFMNSAKSVAIVLIISFVIGLFVSKKMSRELVSTAFKAQSIELGNRVDRINSNVKEIQVIEHSLDSLKTKLDLKQRSRKKLIDELIHQTRTPLTILKTHIEGYEDDVIELNEGETKVLINEIDNVTSIISNLSGMIDADKDYESISVEKFDVGELMLQITSGMRVQFANKGIKLQVNCDLNLMANTDKYKLSQAVYNVITNAYKYTSSGGCLTIDIKSISDRIIIELKDTGIGIKKEDRNMIFEPYFRGEKSQDKSGDGIGLYVAKENMQQIDGDIRLDDSYTDGSKFIIEFKKL